ncbi:hypothetical protein Dimus_003086, partial [Dionaea muscipula]
LGRLFPRRGARRKIDEGEPDLAGVRRNRSRTATGAKPYPREFMLGHGFMRKWLLTHIEDGDTQLKESCKAYPEVALYNGGLLGDHARNIQLSHGHINGDTYSPALLLRTVIARQGCWSFLKGGFVLGSPSNLSLLYFQTWLRSVLVLNGNGADVAEHCVPAVPTESYLAKFLFMISITFRRGKRPFDYVVEQDLQELQPLSYGHEASKKPISPSQSTKPTMGRGSRSGTSSGVESRSVDRIKRGPHRVPRGRLSWGN